MTWTEITRCQHDRRALRYASNCTAAEWALIEPLMPGPSKVGRPRKTCMRSVWGEKLENALRKIDGPTIEIVKRPDDAKGFVIVARRWVVERTLAWLNRCRRLAKDWEASVNSAEAWLLIASTRQLVRRIARSTNVRS
jgi:transposase